MEKQTKNIITREGIEKELRFYNKADVRYTLVLLIMPLLILVPFTVWAIHELCQQFESTGLKIVLSVLVGILTTSPIWLYFLFLGVCFKERKLLRNGDFDIVVREVQYKDEKLVHRHTEKFLHFDGFKEESVTDVYFALASPGDAFYIVHYKGHTTIKLLYPLKLYEFKEK